MKKIIIASAVMISILSCTTSTPSDIQTIDSTKMSTTCDTTIKVTTDTTKTIVTDSIKTK